VVRVLQVEIVVSTVTWIVALALDLDALLWGAWLLGRSAKWFGLRQYSSPVVSRIWSSVGRMCDKKRIVYYHNRPDGDQIVEQEFVSLLRVASVGNNISTVLVGGLGTQTQTRGNTWPVQFQRRVESDLIWPIAKETRTCLFFTNDKLERFSAGAGSNLPCPPYAVCATARYLYGWRSSDQTGIVPNS
jgi:hypothetical protein